MIVFRDNSCCVDMVAEVEVVVVVESGAEVLTYIMGFCVLKINDKKNICCRNKC